MSEEKFECLLHIWHVNALRCNNICVYFVYVTNAFTLMRYALERLRNPF